MNKVLEDHIEIQFAELKREAQSYNHNADTGLLEKGWEFAKLAHTGQKRLSGEPYATHSLETAKILAGWKLDIDSIVAGLLHDTIEDGGAKREDIVKEFGEEVALLVDGVTKVSNIRLRGSKDEEFVENLRKMFLAMAKDLRVVLIKLADRLHNMQTLSVLPPEKQIKIAKETLEIYAPLSERLGMGEVKSKLDDLSFPYVYPVEYKKVAELAKEQYKKASSHLIKMKRALLSELARENIRAKIDGRKKHLYSMWRKLERPEIAWDFSQIYDIVAIRILVDNIADCYTALGKVHRQYKPVPHLGVSDFIAQPKPNGYQSIHTKVFGPEGRIVEVQIKTFKMHEENEHGVAAHWYIASLKTRGKATSKDIDAGKFGVRGSKLGWVRQLADWQNELTDSNKFLEAVKFDALSQRIFVFSPKGDVYDLPVDATPVDFACAVHTDLGIFVKAARVNGKLVPLNSKLKSGDVVEIVKTKNPKQPTPDWLEFVATNAAKREINKHLRKKF
jgi:GTP diphosphokinase / guanosine-3',5'-bis(diphosphate) 3'-diphosphatase